MTDMVRHPLAAALALLLVATAIWPGASRASLRQVQLSDQQQEINLGRRASWIAGYQMASPQAILQRFLAGKGQAVKYDFPGFGIAKDGRWLLIKLDNQASRRDWILRAGRPQLDRVDVYLFDASRQLQQHWWSGNSRPIEERPLPHHRLIFPLSLDPGVHYLLLHAMSDNTLDVPVTLFTPKAFYQADSLRSLIFGLYFGGIGLLCLYNLLIFLSIRDRSYLYYVAYLGGFGIFLMAREGLGFRWLWPYAPDWNSSALITLSYFTLAACILFTCDFLQLARFMPRVNRVLLFVAAVEGELALLTEAFFHQLVWINLVSILVWPFTFLVIALLVLRRGYAPARYFLAAFFVSGLAVTLYSFKGMHLLPNSWLLENSLQISVLAEALLLSFALAHRMTVLKNENEKILQSARQGLEAKVHARTRELRQALDARSQFLATMSHEIRTPLNGILGTLDLFKSSRLDPQQRQQAAIIERSGNNLLHLISDILDYSRIEAGKMPLNSDYFNLAELADDCCALFRQSAELNGTRLELEVHDKLQQQAVKGDAMRVRQLLINLISNAIKFTTDGQVHVTLSRHPQTPQRVQVDVRDSGVGIDEAQQQRLFQLFQQADSSTSRQYGGTGLGLAICKQLVDLMDGDIGVNSEAGKGSHFWFWLPLAAVPKDKLRRISQHTARGRAGRLLIVDDNPTNLLVTQGLCQKLGHEVETCDSGRAAIATLLDDQVGFDAVLMDCEMPVMDGFDTTREIIRLQKDGRINDMPVVALTAHVIADKIRACHEAGMIMHITKPINLEKIHYCLTQLLPETGGQALIER